MFDKKEARERLCAEFIRTGSLDPALLLELRAYADSVRQQKRDGRCDKPHGVGGRYLNTGRGRDEFIGPRRPRGRPRKSNLDMILWNEKAAKDAETFAADHATDTSALQG